VIQLRPRLRLGDMTGQLVTELRSVYTRGTLAGMFSLGRDAFWHLAITKLAPREMEVWLPAYSCSQLLDAFATGQVPMHFYDIRPDLSIDWRELQEQRARCAGRHALVFIDYFGMPTPVPVDVRDNLLKSFDLVIRDAAHGLPCGQADMLTGSQGGYVVYSLRKPLPIPDLALIYGPSAFVQEEAHGRSMRRLFSVVESAGLLIPRFGRSRLYSGLRQRLKDRSLRGARPSFLSRLFATRIDQAKAMHARRSAAARLLSALKTWAVFPSVPEEACPYYFPVFLRRPDQAQMAFQRLGIETTRFWGLDGVLRTHPGARHVASSILCLPVHQDLADTQITELCQTAEVVCEAEH
jgi:dTDP-4-amino-4,6-dideoxygalactose transaminase